MSADGENDKVIERQSDSWCETSLVASAPVFFNPTHCGIVTSLGVGVRSVAAAVRAGVSNFCESGVYDRKRRPMIMSSVPRDILPDVTGEQRRTVGLAPRQWSMLCLAMLAVDNFFTAVNGEVGAEPLPLFLALPDLETDVRYDLFLSILNAQTGGKLDVEKSVVCGHGRASGLMALQKAMRFLHDHESDRVLLFGIDTYNDLAFLSALVEDESRVLGHSVKGGFVPGEAAAILLLRKCAGKGGVKIYPPAFACEGRQRCASYDGSGDGLAEAVTMALSNGQLNKVRSVWSTSEKEGLEVKEWEKAAQRNIDKIDATSKLINPMAYFGDIGAAFGPTVIALAAMSVMEGYFPGPSLVCCASDCSQRSAVCLATES